MQQTPSNDNYVQPLQQAPQKLNKQGGIIGGGGATGLRFLSPNSVISLSSSMTSHNKTLLSNNNNTIISQIRNELFKIVSQQVSSSFGPNGKFKLVTDINQSQIITKSGAQILEFIKTNNPIVQYLISLFGGVANEFCDGTISCLLMSYELLDLICTELGNKHENIYVICAYLHQIVEKMFSNDEILSQIQIKIHESSEDLPIFIKSLIDIQIQSNHLRSLLFEWFKYSSNEFTNLHLISESNLNISKSLGKIDDSKLMKNSLTLQSLQNLNIKISNEKQQYRIGVMSGDLDQNIAIKIDCDIIIIVGKQINMMNRRFIQFLNERNILVFFYPSSSTNNMYLLFKLMDVLQITGIATCFDDFRNYNFGISNVKIIFKNNGQHCDLTFGFENGIDGFSTLQLKSQSQENLNQIEYQIIKCIRHVKHCIGSEDREIIAIVGGGSFECHLSKLMKKLADNNEDELFGIIVNIISRSLLSIPKTLLLNSLASQFNERYFFQLLEDLVKKNNREQVTFINQSCLQQQNNSVERSHYPLTTISRSEINQSLLESFHNRKHIIETSIQIVINILRMDAICFNNQ